MSINWFPGHMAKAMEDIQTTKNVDLLIEVVDARTINLSSNKELFKNFKKDKITIALKADLADINKSQYSDNNLLIGSLKNRNFKNEIINFINKKLSHKIQTLKSKGLINPHFYILVVGLPNVGKSSLINFLGNKQQLLTANKPGVTRNKQLVKISPDYSLYDTPGVFVKKVNNDIDGYKLALIGTIKKEIIPINEVCKWAYAFLIKHYLKDMQSTYKFTDVITYPEFISHLCKKYKFIRNNSELDFNRANTFFFNELTNGPGFKLNYEKEN